MPRAKTGFSGLYLASALQDEVRAWAEQGWNTVTPTTYELLNYWFNRDKDAEEKFHDCQRRAIETIIYCHEIVGPESLKELFERVAPQVLEEHLPVKREVEGIGFPKYALKMATGSGKTWVLAALLVWQYFNRINGGDNKKFSARFLVVAPGHEVLNRLLDSFKGKRIPGKNARDPNTSDYRRDLFMPPGARWRDRFHLEILEPSDVRPNKLPPDGPFVLLTNWQQFRLKSETKSIWEKMTGADLEETPRGEVIADFLTQYPDLVVMNDEAHHVHGAKGPEGEELIWRRFMSLLHKRMNEKHGDEKGLFMQIDYSATPFYGSKEKKEYFPHIVYDYDLPMAMEDMLVKQIFLEERQKVAGEELADLDFRAERAEPEGSHKRGKVIALSQGQKLLLEIGRSKLEQLAVEFRAKGIEKKPVLLILAENTDVADLVRDHFRTLTDEHGLPYDESQVMLIHSELPDKELEEARRRLDLIDDNNDHLRVVVSVLMLREGFDKKNICVTVVLRATEADLLLEQIVGRGLRLMFPKGENPEFDEAKQEACNEIRSNKTPSCSLDFLFIVEHPRFREFYEKLKQEGYAIGTGDTSARQSTGDLIPVDAITDRIPKFDIGWPIQIFDSAEKIDLSKIKPSELPKYPGEFSNLRKIVGGIKITDTHMGTGKKVKTWVLPDEHFDYSFFLQRMTLAVVMEGSKPILSGMKAEVAGLIDEYVSKHCFGEAIDFSKEENYRILNYQPVFDHIHKSLRQAILALSKEVLYEYHGRWGKLSDVPRLMIRESRSVPSEKCIYPLVGYQPKGGGLERDFMLEILEPSVSVLAYAKLDRRHNLKIPYRDEIGVLRNYEVDFIVKTSEKMYLVETKADRDLERPEVAVKIRAASAWCEQASMVKPPEDLNQPADWEYLIISEGFFKQNRGLSFEALKDSAKLLREQLVARYEQRLL